MSDSPADPRTRASTPPAEDRLESWKDIATYLDKDVRTVQRWEEDAGLPVSRPSQGKIRNVYASRSELDAWRNHPGVPPDAGDAGHILESAPLVPAAPRRWDRLVAGAGVVLVAVAVGASIWPERTPSLDFEARDWVLIADFENHTDGAIADGTVEYALAHALGESRFANVVPRARVVDTLGLMRRPPETAVDAAVGREIALRDGGIRAMLTGRVDKLDTTYALSAVLVEPATGRTVASVREEAAGDSEFLPAVHRLSSRVRARLGEALADIEPSAQPLEKVTTPSLSALQLFSQALIPRGKSDVAVSLLRQAVAEDPDFASGYMHLAWIICNQDRGRPVEDYLPHAERAVKLSETTSDRERYFILGRYYALLGQDENAVRAFEALLRLHPDHYLGTLGLANSYSRLGRSKERARWHARRADLRPSNLLHNHTAAAALLHVGDLEAAEPYVRRAQALASAEGADPLGVARVRLLPVSVAASLIRAGNLEAAEPYVRRAQALASAEGADPFVALLVAQASFLPVYVSWRRGDPEEAQSTLQRLVASGPPTSLIRDEWFYIAAQAYLGLGMLHAARETAVQIASTEWRHTLLQFVAWARGDQQAVRDHVQRLQPWGFSLMLLARAGAVDEARNALVGSTRALSPAHERVVRGELARLEGRLGEAIPLLEEGIVELGTGHPLFYLGVGLARAGLAGAGRAVAGGSGPRRGRAGCPAVEKFLLLARSGAATGPGLPAARARRGRRADRGRLTNAPRARRSRSRHPPRIEASLLGGARGWGLGTLLRWRKGAVREGTAPFSISRVGLGSWGPTPAGCFCCWGCRWRAQKASTRSGTGSVNARPARYPRARVPLVGSNVTQTTSARHRTSPKVSLIDTLTCWNGRTTFSPITWAPVGERSTSVPSMPST